MPQLYANWQRRGCKGFRPSVIANWIVGDTFKMWFFFASAAGEVPWAFKICGIFQATCDLGLGLQWMVWGDGPVDSTGPGPIRSSPWNGEKVLTSPPPETTTFELAHLGNRAGVKAGFGESETAGGASVDLGVDGWERQRVGM